MFVRVFFSSPFTFPSNIFKTPTLIFIYLFIHLFICLSIYLLNRHVNETSFSYQRLRTAHADRKWPIWLMEEARKLGGGVGRVLTDSYPLLLVCPVISSFP